MCLLMIDDDLIDSIDSGSGRLSSIDEIIIYRIRG